MRGGKKPFEVLVTSNIAEDSGLIMPIPTWAFRNNTINKDITVKKRFIVRGLSYF
jgi:hypothetical protein